MPTTPQAPSAPVRTAPDPRVNPETIQTPDTSRLNTDPATGMDLDNMRQSNQNKEQTARGNSADALLHYTQGLTDSINSKYAAIGQRTKEAVAADDARAYALNSSRGLKDSGTGISALNTEQQKGRAKLDQVDSMKQSEISAALGKAESLRENLDKQVDLTVEKDQKAYHDAVTQNKKDATDVLTAFGKGNVDIKTLQEKEPQVYASLKKALGYSDLEMQAKYNSVKANPVKYQYKIQGDIVTAYGVDADGKLTVQEETVPGLATGQWEIKETKDGDLYKWNKTTGVITPLHSGPPKAPTSTTHSKDEEYDAKNWLARQPGFDKSDLSNFESDPQFKAWAINKANEEKAASKKSGSGANPFAK